MSFEAIRADQLGVDYGYQRRPRPYHVNKIAANFDPLLLGVVTVSQREDGTRWILDGQHRVAAILKRGDGSVLIPCEVLHGLTHIQEAAIFYVRNSATQTMSSQDKFRGQLASEDPIALDILQVVLDAGYRINLDSSELTEGRIHGVGALTNVYRQYRTGHLRETLDLIGKTWGHDHGPHGTTITGTSMFLSFYRDAYVTRKFVSQLSKVSTAKIRDEAADYRKATGVSADKAVAAVIVRHYNTRLGEGNRLPSLEEQRAINMIREAQDGR